MKKSNPVCIGRHRNRTHNHFGINFKDKKTVNTQGVAISGKEIDNYNLNITNILNYWSNRNLSL